MKVTVRLPRFIEFLKEHVGESEVVKMYEAEFRSSRSHGRYTEYIPEPDTLNKWIIHFIKWAVNNLDGRLD